MNETQDERVWKWARRTLGAFGFLFLLGIESFSSAAEIPIAMYGLVAGLLGLDFILEAKRKMENGQ